MQPTHADFGDRASFGANVASDFSVGDPNGHGTHVAGKSLLSSLKTPMEHSLPCVRWVKNTEVLKWNFGNGIVEMEMQIFFVCLFFPPTYMEWATLKLSYDSQEVYRLGGSMNGDKSHGRTT